MNENDPKCIALGWCCIPLATESYSAWGMEAMDSDNLKCYACWGGVGGGGVLCYLLAVWQAQPQFVEVECDSNPIGPDGSLLLQVYLTVIERVMATKVVNGETKHIASLHNSVILALGNKSFWNGNVLYSLHNVTYFQNLPMSGKIWLHQDVTIIHQYIHICYIGLCP